MSSSTTTTTTTTTSTSTYLSATKLVLLLAIDHYSRHYDWGPEVQCELAQLLISRLCEPSWTESWQGLGNALGAIAVPSEENQTLRQLLCRRMDDIDTLDALHVFFDELRALVTSAANPSAHAAAAEQQLDGELILLDSESILGLFVRRCCLAFDQLEFHQTGVFFDECVRAFRVISDVGCESSTGSAQTAVRSRIELQEHLEHQISLLETESGAPVPAEMEDQIRRAMAALPDHSRTHYLDYLNQVRTGECHQAESSLRRFFDSNVIKDNRTIYQYALLYLAAMRAQLGMLNPARHALTEATHVARDCQDHTCLLYIMFWEARLQLQLQCSDGAATNGGGGLRQHQILLQNVYALIDKAVALQNHGVWAAGVISLADYLMQAGAPARLVFSTLIQAHAVLAEHDVRRLRGPWHLAASRAWLHYSDDSTSGCREGAAAVWLALLHAQLALEDQQQQLINSLYTNGLSREPLTERERIQAMCQRARVDSVLCGAAAAATAQAQRLEASSALVSPARADELRDTLEWLQLESAVDGRHAQPRTDLSPCLPASAGKQAQQLADARDLIASGYTSDARHLLLSILCGASSSPATAFSCISRTNANSHAAVCSVDSRAAEADFVAFRLARQLLSSIE
ncbi:hypothetical protein EV178_001917 [Coemansia sp. RSA 1646]|nr:hypothetical protein EV178_001917 [Coemansia sp. RSA 1646]